MKKKIGIYLIGIILAMASFVLLRPDQAFAAVTTEQSDFEIQPILPDEQVDMSLNYFNLSYPRDVKRTIRMRVQNFTDHKIVVHSDLRNAYTQSGGGIDFTAKKTGLDSSLQTPFTQVAKLTKGAELIKLNPKEVKIISATIQMPKKDYRGMIYGDWHFIEYGNKGTKGANAVGGNYAYSVGIILQGSPYLSYPDLKYVETKPILYQRHPAMGIKLRDPKVMAITKATVSAVILKKGVLGSTHSFKATNVSIAPNSTLTLPISWNYEQLKAGEYEIRVKVKGQNFANKFPQTWQFKKWIEVNI
ncbi:DUF916 and DUF3324 domain-containing protein [Loigolactobacillus zhaoyuanensis]|uniref:DUF916 and DUF3324 domain-containing protein n=1 Tax=Loigolactobacillus zhaoyuanensis TaxID=2486017 RepID=UPI0013DDA006|nr:DUF916 and DUF3324 domain-containing protein [Loigolactobacillus zhaoyuanensis]